MAKIDWSRVKYFSPDENWGDPEKMIPELIYTLDAFRKYLGRAINVNCGWSTKGHSSKSQHYIGRAADISFGSSSVDLLPIYLAAERFGFNGLGLYPDWYHPGLHLDVRVLNVNAPKHRWIRVDKGDIGYIDLNAENLLKYVVNH